MSIKTIARIEKADIVKRGVQSLADKPNSPSQYGTGGLSANQLKLAFDNLSTFLAAKINEILGTISSAEAAEYIALTLNGYEGIETLQDFIDTIQGDAFVGEILRLYSFQGAESKVSLQEYVYALNKVLFGFTERLKDLEDKESPLLTVGEKPIGYADSETLWSTIGERPKIYGKHGSLWNAIYSETETLKTGIVGATATAEAAEKTAHNLDRRLTNLEAVSEGVSYITETVSDVAYETPIPTKAAPVFAVDRIGSATHRVLDRVESKADFSTAVGDIGGVVVTYDDTRKCLILNGTYYGVDTTHDLWGNYFSATEPASVSIKCVGGTVTGSRTDLYLWDEFYSPISMDALTNTLNTKAVTGQAIGNGGGYGVGCVAFYFSYGSVFANYHLQILVDGGEFYELTPNKPTALRAMSKNLVPFPYKDGIEKTSGGVTFTVDDEGIITAERTGATGANGYFLIAKEVPLKAGTYTLSGSVGGALNTSYAIAGTFAYANGTVVYYNAIAGATTFTLTADAVATLQIIYYSEYTGKAVFKPQLERGTTATAYTKPSATISTTDLPDLSDLDGWGQGVPSVGGNYIAFTDDGRVLYQRTTERVALTGAEEWHASATVGGGSVGRRFYCRVPKPSAYVDTDTITPSICNEYEVKTGNETYNGNRGVSFASTSAYFYDASYANGTVDEWKAYVAQRYAEGNPIIIEYALADLPDPIDITDRFEGFDGFFEGQGNGSVIIENEHKADLPSTMSYTVSLRE